MTIAIFSYHPTVSIAALRPVIFGSQYYLCIMADRERFLDFFLPVEPLLVRFARALAGNNDDARDVVGETVLTALEQFENLSNEDSFKFFLFTIARRTYWKTVLKKRLFIPLDKKHEELQYDDSAIAESSHDIVLLYEALHKLPFKIREAISLFELGGFSLVEIQAIQGGSLSGVKTRLARGRLRLKKSLSDLTMNATNQISEEHFDSEARN
jgi:RNA polymerase sigma-70 factor, ECF subfamily